MKLKIFISFLYFLHFFSPSRADQSSQVDSLYNVLTSKTATQDTVRVKQLNEIAHQLLRVSLDTAYLFALETEKLSKKLDFDGGLSRALYLQGSYYWLKGENALSIKKSEAALAIAEVINSPAHKASALNGLGIAYVQMNDVDQGLDYLNKAIIEAEKTDDDVMLSYLLANVGWLHLKEENYEMAEKRFFRLIELAEKNNDNGTLTATSVALGKLYVRTNRHRKALTHFNKIIKIAKEDNDVDMEGFANIYLGDIYSELGQNNRAENHLMNAKKIFEALESENRLLEVYASLAHFYTKRERHGEAIEVADMGLKLSNKLNSEEYQPVFYESLTSAKLALEDYEGAFALQREFMSWNDSLNAKKKDQRILELETRYQTEQIATENELLKAKQERQDAQIKLQYLIFLFILVSTFFVGITLFSLNQKNKKLKSANEEVIKSSKVKQEFLSTMSHEIRTPLNAVIGFTELLATERPRSDQMEYVSGLKASSQHLLELINNVLDFSKIEAKKVELEHIPFDLEKQLKSVVHTYRISNTNKDLDIQLKSDLDLNQLVIGDSTRLYQVLSNLLSNSVKFTKKGVIVLEVKTLEKNTKATQLQFVVSDTGIGIPEDKRQLIFEDFIQGSNATTREFGGSGLGLPICQQLVSLMGGEIQLESEVGKGSQFKFDLSFPIAQMKRVNNISTKSNITQEQPLKGCKILLVEDNLLNQKIALAVLQRNGAEVIVANNGKEAVQAVYQQDLDLILMDLHMPVMDGFEAIEIIRNLPYPKNETQIIVLTATASDVELKYPLEFVQKPFHIEQLIAVVKRKVATT
ncbi:MAG: ATP-binding protein [Bacteroidota bacterium]